jgi:acetyl esterase/lipase
VTSLEQREWDKNGKIHNPSLEGYVDVVKKIAAEKKVPLVDLNARSIELYDELGKDGCAALSPGTGSHLDITHLNALGSELIGPIVFAELTAALPELAKFAAVLDKPVIVPLWKDGAPGTEGHREEAERPVPDLPGRVTNINNPSLTVYLPPSNQATGAAIVVAPGGGHEYLAIENEGYQVGKWLAEHGIAGLVLKYRCYKEKSSPYRREDAISDGKRAMRIARSHVNEWHIRPDRIGFLGFSAGGDLTLAVAQNSDGGSPEAVDPIDRFSSRPDFQVPVYPGGLDRAAAETAHDTPPTLLICAEDDHDNIAAEMPNLYLALRKAEVPVEMHVFGSGGHGFGMRPGVLAVNHWPDRLYEWMHDRGLLNK